MNLYKKGQQRLYFLRKLNALHIDRNILFVFHDSFVKKCYDVRSCLLGGKSLSQKQRKTKQNTHHFLQNRYVLYTRYQSGASQENCKWQLKSYLTPPTSYTTITTSGRRYRMPTVKTQRALKSFIPSSIKYLNHPEYN